MLCTLHKRKNYREGFGKGVKYLGDGGEGTVKYIYINKSASGLYYTEERRSPGNFFLWRGGRGRDNMVHLWFAELIKETNDMAIFLKGPQLYSSNERVKPIRGNLF